MRKLIREAAFGLTEIKSEEIWRCTTCGKCPQRCPRDVKQINNMIALRRMATGYGVFPATVKPLRAISAGLVADGNPFGRERAKRADWAEGLVAEGMEVLYFPGPPGLILRSWERKKSAAGIRPGAWAMNTSSRERLFLSKDTLNQILATFIDKLPKFIHDRF